VTVDVFGVAARQVPRALGRMARDGRALHRTPGLRFGRLLGTSTSTTFSLRSTDLRHWVVLCSWATSPTVQDLDQVPVLRAWNRISEERLRVRLEPLAARGRWGGHEPFGTPAARPVDGPVASITRARIALTHLPRFWRAVPAVARDLAQVDGVRLALGMGEAPVGFQGTFSIWQSPQAVREFAHRRSAHQDVVRRTGEVGWYAEELFARFAVLDLDGTYRGRVP
jgi:hypothetical protein